MKCPNDSATLIMSERAGVEIDYCPECRGVWLDRGELDKILERAEAEISRSATAVPAPPPARPSYDDRDRDRDRDRRSSDSHGGYRSKKKEHWLGELFG